MKAEQILDQITELPSPPQVAWKLMELLRKPTQNSTEVVQIIEYDPGLTAKLLKACNSVFWSRGEPVASVKEALMRLGYREVLRIVLALSVGGTLASENQGYGHESMELWHHSVVTALTSQKIAHLSRVGDWDPEMAFTAGLLHDIGKTVLNHVMSQEAERIRQRVEKEGIAMVEAEREVMGVDHAEVGACLLKRWNFPQRVVDAVATHHAPQTQGQPSLGALIHLANGCAHQVGSSFGWNSLSSQWMPEVIDLLQLKPAQMETVMIEVHQQSEQISSFMTII